jgi:hypothetical protein
MAGHRRPANDRGLTLVGIAEVRLRDVRDDDLATFFEHQRMPTRTGWRTSTPEVATPSWRTGRRSFETTSTWPADAGGVEEMRLKLDR